VLESLFEKQYRDSEIFFSYEYLIIFVINPYKHYIFVKNLFVFEAYLYSNEYDVLYSVYLIYDYSICVTLRIKFVHEF